jgi:hypothetical protein
MDTCLPLPQRGMGEGENSPSAAPRYCVLGAPHPRGNVVEGRNLRERFGWWRIGLPLTPAAEVQGSPPFLCPRPFNQRGRGRG